ncbi:hypothetical protein A6S26_20455 [Nostoc sp. ATCC 43529]|nr:hypothetical protein A6S26_20455 [Nostoc sp. ATCC 43529]
MGVHQRVRWLLQQGHEVFLIHPGVNDLYPKQVRDRCMLRLYSLFLQGYGRPIGTEYPRRTGTQIISIFHTDIFAYIRYYIGEWSFRFLRPIIPTLIKQYSEAYDVNYFSSQEQLTKYKLLVR